MEHTTQAPHHTVWSRGPKDGDDIYSLEEVKVYVESGAAPDYVCITRALYGAGATRGSREEVVLSREQAVAVAKDILERFGAFVAEQAPAQQVAR